MKLKLDSRRVAVGQKLEITAMARDAKNEPILEAEFTTTVTRLDPRRASPTASPNRSPLYPQGDDAQGPLLRRWAQPGEYRGRR